MSFVYKAQHLLMKRLVAIKVLKSDFAASESSKQRFQLEAKAISSLSTRNLVSIFDYGISPAGSPYLVMDLIDGESLQTLLSRQGPLTAERAVNLFAQACSALSHAHKSGIIHRDLKPSNLIVLKDDSGADFVKLVDFGIAKLLDMDNEKLQKLTQSGEIFGSPVYVSPEQCLGRDTDGRSDIYSLGCVIYEAVSGHKPFDGTTAVEIAGKHLNEFPPQFSDLTPAPRISPALSTVIFKAIAKDREKRFQTMLELKEALERTVATGSGKKAAFSILTGKWSAVILSAILLALAAAFLLNTGQGRLLLDRLHLQYQEATLQPNDPALLETTIALADRNMRMLNYKDAAHLYEKALIVLQDKKQNLAAADLMKNGHLGAQAALAYARQGDRDTALRFARPAARNLELAAAGAGRFDKKLAESYFLETLEFEREVFGKESPEAAGTEYALALLYIEQKRYDTAEQLLDHAIEAQVRNTTGRSGRQSVQWSRSTLAEVYDATGRPEKAESILKRTIAERTDIFGAESPITTDSLVVLGNHYCHHGLLSKGIATYKKALALDRAATPSHPTALSRDLSALVPALIRSGQFEEADPLLAEQLDLTKKNNTMDTEFPLLRITAQELANRKQWQRAEKLYRAMIEIWAPSQSHVSAQFEQSKFELASLLIERQKFAEAEALLKPMVAEAKDCKDCAPTHQLNVLASLATSCYHQHKLDECKQFLNLAAEQCMRSSDKTNLTLAATMTQIATLFKDLGMTREAETILQKELALFDGHDTGAMQQRLNALTVYSELAKSAGHSFEVKQIDRQIQRLKRRLGSAK